jgi:hypothetical protein
MIHRLVARLVLLLAALMLVGPEARAVTFTVKNCSNVFTSFYAHDEGATDPYSVISWVSIGHGETGSLNCGTARCRMQVMPHTGATTTRSWHHRLIDGDKCFLVFSGTADFYLTGGYWCVLPQC